MDENYRTNEITYDDDWQSVTTPEYADTVDYSDGEEQENEADSAPKSKKRRDSPRQLLMIIQLIACLLVCLCAFALKSLGGDLYETVRIWYEKELNNELISDGELNSIDFSALLKNQSTADEA